MTSRVICRGLVLEVWPRPRRVATGSQDRKLPCAEMKNGLYFNGG